MVIPQPTGLDRDVLCPLCDYNLRGLTECRCPECGFHFDLSELLDPARRRHPWLFEHHPHRNRWSFCKTFIGGLRPSRFWRSLYPTQPSSPRRLLLYWTLVCSLLAAVVVIDTGQGVAQYATRRAGYRAWWPGYLNTPAGAAQLRAIRQTYGSVNAWLDETYPPVLSWRFVAHLPQMSRLPGQVLVWLLWPWLTFLTLLIFRISMRRARIKPVHVLRCVIYSCDLLLLVGAAGLVALLAETRWPGLGAGLPVLFARAGFWAPARSGLPLLVVHWAGWLSLLCWTWRLSVAYRRYLRFEHPLATVLLSQSIVSLVAAIAWVYGWL